MNQYAYGSMGMFGSKRSYRRHDDSFDEYDVSDHNFTESSEFAEEQLTEESEEEMQYSESMGDMSVSGNGGAEISMSVSTEETKTDSSSNAQLEDVEQDEENVIDEVLDMMIVPFEDSWKYPPSLLVRPEPDDVWKYDDLRPKNKNQIPRSDGCLILERLKYLEEDVDNAPEETNDKPEQLPRDQQKVFF